MIKCGVLGCGWGHAYSTTLYKKSKSIEWAYNAVLDTTFFVDNSILDSLKLTCPNKILWQVETRTMFPHVVEFIKKNHKEISKNCRYLLTHCTDIVGLEPNFVYQAPHASWVDNPGIYSKTKLVSFLTSSKNWLPGHEARLNWLSKLGKHCHVYGRGFNEVAKVEEALQDYYFSVCIENNSNYYSEKLLNCLALGTVPIYIGDKETVSQKFNPKGIIFLDENFDINSLTVELYQSMLPYIEENLKIATEYETVEDEIFEKYLI